MMKTVERFEATHRVRCAIYSRYSSYMQRPASLENQRRNCETAAARQGWEILDDHIYSDAALSGRSRVGRHALDALIAKAKERDRPFDYVICDDTSRLARTVEDVLNIVKILKFHGVNIYFASQELDSRSPAFELTLAVFGIVDSQQIARLQEKVHAGQMGRVLEGYSSGSRCYGYRSIVVASEDAATSIGRAKTVGTRWEIIEEEAVIVRRIFDRFADGHSIYGICCDLNEEKIPSSRKPRIGNVESAWNCTIIKNILHRERYRGKYVWNQTTQEENPETGQIVTRRKGRSEHVVVDVPHLRIVSDEQWARVEERQKALDVKNSARRLGGLNRAKKKDYLFSGMLVCGECGENLRISGGKNLEASYECPNHRHKRGCNNRIRIREDRLADQLTEALSARLLAPENFVYLVKAVAEELDRYIKHQRTLGPGQTVATLQAQQVAHRQKISNLLDAIEDSSTGRSDYLPARLVTAENELKRIEQKLREATSPAKPNVAIEDLTNLVRRNVLDLQEVLQSDVIMARQLLQGYAGRLVLFPGEVDGEPVYEVVGELDLFIGEETGIRNSALLDRSFKETVQQHTDHLYRFTGLRLYPRRDLHEHPVVSALVRLSECAPELMDEPRTIKKWAEVLKQFTSPSSDLYDRLNFAYVSSAFQTDWGRLEARFIVAKTRNLHTGATFYSFRPADRDGESSGWIVGDRSVLGHDQEDHDGSLDQAA